MMLDSDAFLQEFEVTDSETGRNEPGPEVEEALGTDEEKASVEAELSAELEQDLHTEEPTPKQCRTGRSRPEGGPIPVAAVPMASPHRR